MILSAEEIKKEIVSGEITINPFDEAMLKAGSYTFTLGNKIRRLKPRDFVDTRVELARKAKSEEEEFDIVMMDDGGYLMQPGEFLILESREKLKLGETVCCFLAVRGSRAQEGLDLIGSAIFCEPGSEGGFGQLSLEAFNRGPYPIKLFPGVKTVKGIFQRVQN